jgi:hypothetical protein
MKVVEEVEEKQISRLLIADFDCRFAMQTVKDNQKSAIGNRQ